MVYIFCSRVVLNQTPNQFMKNSLLGSCCASVLSCGRHLLLVSLFALTSSLSPAQQDSAAEQAAKFLQKYSEAWHKHDPAVIAAMYTEDARFENEYGEVLQGREAIQKVIADSVTGDQGAELVVHIESARSLGKDVLLVRGTTSVTKDESVSESEFSATMLKTGEQWLIADVIERALAEVTEAESQLANLAALVGTWRPVSDSSQFETQVTMSLNGRFLTRKTKSLDEANPFTSVEIIGYDPVNNHLKSWFFDSEGGFGEGFWREDEDKWVVHRDVTMPDGGKFSSEYRLSWEDMDHLIVETVSKSLNGQVLPNTKAFKMMRAGSENDDLNLSEE